MGKTLAYVQASTDRQDVDNQRKAILAYARQEEMVVDEYIEMADVGHLGSRKRRIDELTGRLQTGDVLVVLELSRLGRSSGEVITLIDQLLSLGVAVALVKDNLRLARDAQEAETQGAVSLFGQLAGMEEAFSSLRTKKALAARKAEGVILGKPRGTIQSSIYDKDRERIQELLQLGVSQRQIIATHLGYGTANSLRYYIRTRRLREGLERATL